MKLSEKTVGVLKNFAGINQGILFKEGNTLRTIAPQKNIMARAEIVESFPKEFAIYDLNRLLGVLSLFKDPDLKFNEGHLSVTDGKNSVKYVYADPSVIIAAPDKNVVLPSTDVQFELTENDMASVLKAAGIVGVPDVSFVGDGNVIVMKAHDKKNSSSNEYAIEIAKTDKTFSVDYRIENFKMIPGCYSVSISSKMISKFEGDICEYFVACETTSKF